MLLLLAAAEFSTPSLSASLRTVNLARSTAAQLAVLWLSAYIRNIRYGHRAPHTYYLVVLLAAVRTS